jgi:3-hydroxyacyl-[acyl-carrier-protein] dehydratase
MRWFWIDRFTEFVSKSHLVATKSVSMSEEHLHDHFPGFPVMPHSLIIEGMAQTGGVLLGEAVAFESLVVLAKLGKVEFQSFVVPGETITYTARLQDVGEHGGATSVNAAVGTRAVASAEIMFGFASPDMVAGVTMKNIVFDGGLKQMLDQSRLHQTANTTF